MDPIIWGVASEVVGVLKRAHVKKPILVAPAFAVPSCPGTLGLEGTEVKAFIVRANKPRAESIPGGRPGLEEIDPHAAVSGSQA